MRTAGIAGQPSTRQETRNMPKIGATLAAIFGLRRKPAPKSTAIAAARAVAKAAGQPKSKRKRDRVQVRPSGECTFDVVGESHYQAKLLELGGDHDFDRGPLSCDADLVPEPTNRFDRNAVYVRISGRKVAYLSRDDAQHYLAELDRHVSGSPIASVRAEITGGYTLPNRTRAHFGVRLDLDWPVDFA